MKEGDLSFLTPTKKPKAGDPTEEQIACNRMLSAMRAIAEHPLLVVMRQFGSPKVSYPGLVKNIGQTMTPFVLANPGLARMRLLPSLGEEYP